MISIGDVLKIFDSVEKWRKLATLPKEVEALTARIAELERKLAHKDPLACRECGHVPVAIETKRWESATLRTAMQTVRRICPSCGRIDGRDEEIGGTGVT